MTSNQSKIVTDEPAEAVRRISLNRPAVMNAIDDDMIVALHAALVEALANQSVRAIIIAGRGDNFSAGGDIRFMRKLNAERFAEFHGSLLALCHLIGTADKPLIAAAQGACVGGALGIALACDQLIASFSTRFLIPFMRIGLTPDMALPYWLARRIGSQATRNIILRDEPLSSDRAMELGLCDHVVEDDDLDTASVAAAVHLAGLAPVALRQTRRLLRDCDLPLDEYLANERSAAAECLGGPEFQEGVAAFIEKRRAIWPQPDRED